MTVRRRHYSLGAMGQRIAIILSLVLLAAAATPGIAEQSAGVALLIGNAVYPDADTPLPEPVKDARALAEELRRRGFDVAVGENLKKVALARALDQFYGKINSNSTAVIFFSGFGIQINRQSYMIPVDAQIWNEPDVGRDGFSLDGVLGQMAARGARVKVAIVDASRRNPYERRFRSGSTGLAPLTTPRGTVAMISAPPDSVVDTSPPVFMTDFLNELKAPGATIEQTFNRTRLDVSRDTQSQQVPWFSSSLDQDVTLEPTPRPAGNLVAQPPPNANAPKPSGNSVDAARRDLLTDCDRLAGHPFDEQRPPGAAGVLLASAIDVVAALKACRDATRQYPDVARFVFETGRVAYAQQDYASARQDFEKAAGMGSKIASAEVGILYMRGQGVDKDYSTARQLFENAAGQGVAIAMTSLGVLYANGWGVDKDYVLARRWYEKAAAIGEPAAMDELGWLYQNGLGVSPDFIQAHQWYDKAAAAGQPAAMNHLGILFERGWGVAQSYPQAGQWYAKAAAAGNAPAMNNLGWLAQNGFGVAKDYGTARQWYEKAAAAGNAQAMDNLGVLYSNGWGVAKDYTQASQWYQKAADSGLPAAMNNLGWFYQNGYGVTKDYTQARQWYEKGASQGNVPAMNNLGVLFENGWGVPQDYGRAREWYETAATAGFAPAMNNLGLLYQNGLGVTKDLTQARQWYEKAAAAGNDAAKANLQKLGDKK